MTSISPMAGGVRPIRVVALTPAGAALAQRLCEALPGAECWLPASRAVTGSRPFHRLAEVFAEAFAQGADLICIMATGIVVRHLAPLLQGKDRDPAVVVLDEKGRFAISLLSGHLGGANELAQRAAAAVGATPVITTATDAQALPALDVLAAQAGLVIENLEEIKTVSMALLSGRPVQVVDNEGLLLESLKNYPRLFHFHPDLNSALRHGPQPTVYVGWEERPWPPGWLRLRPRRLVVGVGCHRGIPGDEVYDFIHKTFRQAGLSLLAIKALATIAAKKDEPGLKEAARRLHVDLLWFTAEELDHIPVPHPSPQAVRHVGAKSVSEAAALKAAGGELVVPKQKSANVTLAVARVISPS